MGDLEEELEEFEGYFERDKVVYLWSFKKKMLIGKMLEFLFVH
jgi:hypothetical protein